MDACLRELNAYRVTYSRGLRGDVLGLARLIGSEVVVHQGCYIWSDHLRGYGRQPDAEGEFVPDRTFIDRTGYECFANHIHVDTLVHSHKPGIHYLAIGLAVAEVVQLKLQQGFPGVHFHIIVGYNVIPLDEEDVHVKDDCTVRFHAVHEGDIACGCDQLERYDYDAVGVKEI